MQMNGQWIGAYTGSNTGTIVIEIDDMDDHYFGYAHVYDSSRTLPNSFVVINAPKNTDKFSLNLQIYPLDPRNGMPTQWDQVKSLYSEDVIFPQTAEVHFDLSGDCLEVSWKTNIETTGSAKLPKSQADKSSEYKPDSSIQNWKDFKEHVNQLEPRRFIFRGQNGPWRLRTSFHRKGRADLVRFITQDIQALHRNLSARTKHIFNLNIPDENGAFFNLVQHHGYPTPLLDWTYSPYVGAFFAYRYKNVESKNVRILVFDQKKWRNDFNQIQTLAHAPLHFSLMEFIAINNERMIPQQAVSSVSNIDDIETYIRSKENDTGNQYLRVIELPKDDRHKVMQELSVMGITAGSLFPGLDGACEELKERFFYL